MFDIEGLYQEYFLPVYKYILTISHDQSVAEEIVQDTFFKAMKKIDSFRGDSSIRVWLCQIAKNTYIDYLKKQSKYTGLSVEYAQHSGIAPVDSREGVAAASSYEASMPEEKLLRDSELKAIYRILHDLKEPYKEVFSLRTLGELSYADIGELFGKTQSWARVTYHRAKLMIREELENGKY